MLSLGSSYRYYLYRPATDMRKGFDGLSGIVLNELSRDPLSGDVFIFINRSRNRMKLLVWESSGFVLWYKRLESGTFELPSADADHLEISWQQLVLILEGITLSRVHHRKRFSLAKRDKKVA